MRGDPITTEQEDILAAHIRRLRDTLDREVAGHKLRYALLIVTREGAVGSASNMSNASVKDLLGHVLQAGTDDITKKLSN